jgi:hypothetical protein
MTTPEIVATVGARNRTLARRLAALRVQVAGRAPALTLKSVLDFGAATDDGRLVRAVALPGLRS